MDSGYITEIRAGDYFQRKCFSSILGSRIKILPREIDYETGEEKRSYIYLKNGEKREMKRTESLNKESVRKRCQNVKWLIRANEKNIRLFITLTYKVNMTDTKKLYQDFRKFWQRLKFQYPVITGYLVAFEPQKRGAWHAHLILLSDKKCLFISNKKIARIWGKGFTKTQKTKSINQVAEYLVSYLLYLEKGKKGSRLEMYPKNFRFFRNSKNLEKIQKISFNGFCEKNIPFLFSSDLLMDKISLFSFDKQNEKIVCRTILFKRIC